MQTADQHKQPDITVDDIAPQLQTSVLSPEPGDVLVIKSREFLSQRQRDWLLQQVSQFVPAGVKPVVLDGGVDLQLIKKPTTA